MSTDTLKEAAFDMAVEAVTKLGERIDALETEIAQKDAQIKALAEALCDSAPRFSATLGPCWCPLSVTNIPVREEDHGTCCAPWRAALRLAGVLK